MVHLVLLAAIGCASGGSSPDGSGSGDRDAGGGGAMDAAPRDGGGADAGGVPRDAGPGLDGGGTPDAGRPDVDAGMSGTDAGRPRDAGPPDAGRPPDAGPPAGCGLPPASCSNGTQSRAGCSNAQIIGRLEAMAGTTRSGSTCAGGNNFDQMCGMVPGGGRDHAYRMYMLAGETVDIEARTSTGCSGGAWNGVFRIFENAGCMDTACAAQVRCRAAFSFHMVSYTAPRDGWVIFVMDGQTIGGIPESGSYTVEFTLTCTGTRCGC